MQFTQLQFNLQILILTLGKAR